MLVVVPSQNGWGWRISFVHCCLARVRLLPIKMCDGTRVPHEALSGPRTRTGRAETTPHVFFCYLEPVRHGGVLCTGRDVVVYRVTEYRRVSLTYLCSSNES